MPLYSAFCLNFQSAIHLPELLPGRLPAEATIEAGEVAPPPPDEQTQIFCPRAASDEAVISWGRVASALVRGGRQIIYQPFPGVSEDALRLFLLGAGLGVLLHQRGLTVLHGSAVAVDGRVVVFVGDKGWGKSSTAAALYARGHSVLSDDLVAVQYDDGGQAAVLPAYPQVKLWPDVVQTLGSDPQDLQRIRPEIEKRVQQMDDHFPDRPLPLACIYILGGSPQLLIKEIPAQDAFLVLMRHLYVARFGVPFLQQTGTASVFHHCTGLVKHARVKVLARTPDLKELPRIAQAIEEDVTG